MQISHFPGGVSTAAESDELFNYPFPDPTEFYQYYNEFMWYTAGDWTVTTTEGGSSDATEAASKVDAGSALIITNDNTTGDLDGIQLQGEAFLLDEGKRAWLKTRLSVTGSINNGDAATYSDILVGLVITDTTPMVHTDGLVFKKDTGDKNIDFSSLENSAGTTEAAIGTLVEGTKIELGMYYDGLDMHLFVDGNKVAVKASASLSDDEYLTPTIYIANGPFTNGIGYSRALTVDYLLVAVER